ncbi:MAG: polysaccharide biosynthesis C-terminal domain-containing protein, partial [Bacteroidota bacterium]
KFLPNGAVEADRYASAFRLLDASNIAGFLLAGLLLPMFSRQLKQGESVRPLVQLGIRTIWTGALILSITLWFYATPVMQALYTDGGPYTAEILQWLMLTFIPMSGGYIYGTLLTANASLRPMNILFGISILINIGLNLWLIPQRAAVGAALATFTTQSIVFTVQLWLAVRLLKLKIDLGLILRFIILACLLIFTSHGLQQYAWPNLLEMGLLVTTGLISALLLRLLDVREWLSFFKP